MKSLFVLIALLAMSTAQKEQINNQNHLNDIEQLDYTGCVNVLNRIKEVGITVDAAGDAAGPTLTRADIFNNKFTKTVIKLYERDCLFKICCFKNLLVSYNS